MSKEFLAEHVEFPVTNAGARIIVGMILYTDQVNTKLEKPVTILNNQGFSFLKRLYEAVGNELDCMELELRNRKQANVFIPKTLYRVISFYKKWITEAEKIIR